MNVSRASAWRAIAFSLPYFMAVACLDYVTGDGVVLAMLYIPVIAFVTIRVSLTVAANVALACSFLWLADDVLLTSVHGPTIGELAAASVHFISFVVTAVVISRLKIALHSEYLRARYDYLTQLPNMQTFYSESEKSLQSTEKSNQPFSVIFFDCDNFKTVNDTMGHSEGNRVLQVIASELRSQTREQDCIARFGGDEFVALFPNTNPADSKAIIERLRERLLAQMKEHGWPVTFSIGIANFSNIPDSIEQAVKIADEVMYDCKQQSKDAIFIRKAG